MLETFKNAWRIEEIRKKILYTLLMLFILRIGSSLIPVAGVNASAVKDMVGQYDILNFLNMLTGGSFANFTIFAVGISPNITASIVIQLLTFAIPALEKIAKEGGEEGREKMQQYTRYLGLVLAFVMSIGMVLSLQTALVSKDFLSLATIVLSLVGGSMIVNWLADNITEKGIGNGMSLVIFIGIISSLPWYVIDLFTNIGQQTVSTWSLVPIVLIAVVLIAGVVFVDSGERRIPVQYAKRVVGRKMYGGQSTHIPMKLNSAGVLPIIFASTLLQFPAMIAQFWPESGFSIWYNANMHSGSIPYLILFAFLIVALGFFYNMVAFNPAEVAKNLQQYGGFILGIRPGRPTSDYLARISSRLTFFGGCFLAILATVPTMIAGLMGVRMALQATGLLICVSVALETTKQLESQMLMRHYRGFLK